MIALAKLPDIVPVEIADPIETNLSAKRAGPVLRTASLLSAVSATPIALLARAVSLAFFTLATSATAQPLLSGPPPVGVVTVQRQPMTDSYEFNGRIQALNSVAVVARVSAFLDQQLFTEGTDVKKMATGSRRGSRTVVMFDSSHENARTSGEQQTTPMVLFEISPKGYRGYLASAAPVAASRRRLRC